MIDERYLMHRYKATSHAGLAGAIALGVMVIYHAAHGAGLRWDLLGVMILMAVVKFGALAWYRRND